MKLLLIILSIAFFVTSSCNSENRKGDSSKVIVDENLDENPNIQIFVNEFETLYLELIEFKEDVAFREIGFGKGGKYSEWMRKLDEFATNIENVDLLFKRGLLLEELRQVGLEYARSEGKETEMTLYYKKVFEYAFSGRSNYVIDTSLKTLSEYDEIKRNYELVGKWDIIVQVGRGEKYSNPYEIYRLGNEYIGVYPEVGSINKIREIETLRKVDNKLYIVGNKNGEYYMIDKNKNMALFDKYGDLESAGWKAIKR